MGRAKPKLTIVRIGTVSVENSAFARVHLTFDDGARVWHHFRSRHAWGAFFHLWAKLQKPWKMRFNPNTGRFFPMREDH